MRYVVGYTPNDRGADAVALASAMARAQGAHLDLVYVVDRNTPYVALNPQGNRVSAAEQSVLTRGAAGPVPWSRRTSRPGSTSARPTRFAAGLIDAAKEYRAGLIVVGAASSRPVQAVQHRQRGQRPAARLARCRWPWRPAATAAPDPITRLTLAVGQRTGAEAAIDVAIESAERRGVPLRLVSLVELDAEGDSGENVNAAHVHANTVLKAAAAPAARRDTTSAWRSRTGAPLRKPSTTSNGTTREIMIVGSSRLAEKNKLFIGSTANKVLLALPVPMVVVPRDYVRIDTSPED